MNTPICDFVREYAKSNALRLHMPGHKGKTHIGMEELDITEIDGADSLYTADGIIRESEKNASGLFGAETFYSTEGSSLCIRAMLYLALLDAKKGGRAPLMLAGRNAHKTFVTAAAMLEFDIDWICGTDEESYLSCCIDAKSLDDRLEKSAQLPAAVYVTSPDYLGNISDIKALSDVCHRHNVPLLVDNAHGAYLKFLPQSQHPVDMGADMCCDSAHKTLPVLTGGAYLHISKRVAEDIKKRAKSALGLFGSTSPSYLILQSLDVANRYIAEGYSKRLAEFLPKVEALKKRLEKKGYLFSGDEPMKLTFMPKSFGYHGFELAAELAKKNIVCEFYDPDFTVVMLTPEIGEEGLLRLEHALNDIPKQNGICEKPPKPLPAEKAMSVRKACMAECEEIPVDKSRGRVFAETNISCPPAVPVVVCGERIDNAAVECFNYYGIDRCIVVK